MYILKKNDIKFGAFGWTDNSLRFIMWKNFSFWSSCIYKCKTKKKVFLLLTFLMNLSGRFMNFTFLVKNLYLYISVAYFANHTLPFLPHLKKILSDSFLRNYFYHKINSCFLFLCFCMLCTFLYKTIDWISENSFLKYTKII